MKSDGTKQAEVIREYGPFEGVDMVHGVTFDGRDVWFAYDGGLIAFDPGRGTEKKRIATDADAGTAFDGADLWQLTGSEIRRIDRKTGKVLGAIPAPHGDCSGLAYADGALWIGGYRDKRILKVDAKTGKVLKTIESDSFVTGVTFADGELWHATMGDGPSEIRHVDPESGAVVERLVMPDGVKVSGLEASAHVFYAGAHQQKGATVRAVKRPNRARASSRS